MKKIGRWVLAIVACFCSAGFGQGVSEAVNDEWPSPPGQAELEELVGQIREMYELAQEALKEMPKDRFDVQPALVAANYDPKQIVEWVRTQTRWVPYKGVLRGAEGVLMDRTGNSLDRSLLLVELLEKAGYETRLVRGHLGDAIAQQLFERENLPELTPVPMEQFSTEKAVATVARAADQASVLAELAQLPGERFGDETISSAADHWWVEADVESGWQAFDPLLSDLPSSERPEAIARMNPASLPEEHFHKVKLRVVIERWDEGQLIEEVPLEHTVRIADSPAKDFELVFVPFGFDTDDEDANASGQALAIAQTSEDWLPVFRSGVQEISNLGFGRDGLTESNLTGLEQRRKLEVATDALAGLETKAEAPKSVLSACWLEYQLDLPGREVKVLRRELFDLFGPHRRQTDDLAELVVDRSANLKLGAALLGSSRILITGSQLPMIALDRAKFELWADQGPQLAALARLMLDPQATEPLLRFHQKPLLPISLLELAVARGELSRYRDAIFMASPNILTTHNVIELGETLKVWRAVDLVFNEVGAFPSGSAGPSRVKLEQGVLDTVLEVALSPVEGPINNTSELFGRRLESNTVWSRIEKPEDFSELPFDARARMASAIAARRAVVAPHQLPDGFEAAWWEIDLASGATLGIGARGWGATATEDVGQRTGNTVMMAEKTNKFGVKVACKVMEAGSYVDDAVDIVRDASGNPWFAGADREIVRRRWLRKYGGARIMTMKQYSLFISRTC